MAQLMYKVMTKVVAKLDPKLEKYRPPKKIIPYVPKNQRDFDALLKRTPEKILTEKQKDIIRVFMMLDEIIAKEIMQPRSKMPILHDSDELSLFTLSNLAKSKAKYYPVLNKEGQVRGFIHADAFDIAKISEDSSIEPYLDKNIVYVRPEYTVSQLISTFARSGQNYLIIIDKNMHLVGDLTLERFLNQLFAFKSDDFCEDADLLSVAKRIC